MMTEFIDLEDKTVVAVTEQHRKKIRYTCASCNAKENRAPCVLACEKGAIRCVWKSL
jgi:Fe-S-cluster-containing hydrogenase component 2